MVAIHDYSLVFEWHYCRGRPDRHHSGYWIAAEYSKTTTILVAATTRWEETPKKEKKMEYLRSGSHHVVSLCQRVEVCVFATLPFI